MRKVSFMNFDILNLKNIFQQSTVTMNIQCPACAYNYSARRIPKNLKNCQHVICQKCLISTEKCPIDGEKIQLKKNGMKSFITNQAILDEVKVKTGNPRSSLNQNRSPSQIPSKSLVYQNLNNQNTQKSEFLIDLNRHIQAQEKNKENSSNDSIALQSKKSINSSNSPVKNIKTTKKIPEQPILKQNNETSVHSGRKPKKTTVDTYISPMKSQTKQKKCNIHSKSADIICLEDGQIICASCALFGNHKGHMVEDTKNFVVKLGELTEETLKLHKQIKQKQDCLNSQVVKDFIQSEFTSKRAQQVKHIKQFCAKMMTAVKNAQKSMIEKYDSYLERKKQRLFCQINLQDLENRTHQWYGEVQRLSQVMKSIFRMQQLSKGLSFLDQASQDSYIQKKGEYLKLQYSSSENVYKSQIQEEVKECQIKFDQSIFQRIENLCQIGKQETIFNIQKLDATSLSYDNKSGSFINRQTSSAKFNTPNSNSSSQNLKQRTNQKQTTVSPTVLQEEEDLLDNNDVDTRNEQAHNTIFSLEQFDIDISAVKNDKENLLASASSIHGQSHQVIDLLSNDPIKSCLKFSTTDRSQSILKGLNDNKKQKKRVASGHYGTLSFFDS